MKTTRIPRGAFNAFRTLIFSVSLCMFAGAPARADLLLYDGFATATDGQNRTPYLNTSDTHKLQSDNAKGEAWTTGVSKNYPWSEQSGVIFTFRNAGLALPADFAEGTGDQFSARGGSLGYTNSSAPDTELRAKNRAITSTMPTSGKLYYRCLMKIDSTTLNSLKTTSWRYYRTGISATPAANAYDNQADLKNNGLQIGFTSPGANPQRVDQGFQMMCPPRLRRAWRIICDRVFMPLPLKSRDSRQAAPLPPQRRRHAGTALRRTCPSCRVKCSCAARTCGASRRTRP